MVYKLTSSYKRKVTLPKAFKRTCPSFPLLKRPSTGRRKRSPRRHRRLPHRDRLWARRQCARRARRRQSVRRQGAAALQPADRACAGSRRGRDIRRGERYGAAARRSVLAGAVVARARRSAPLAESPTLSAPASTPSRLGSPAHPVAQALLAEVKLPARRAERQPLGADQPDHGGTCGGGTRRPRGHDPRRRPLPARHRVRRW